MFKKIPSDIRWLSLGFLLMFFGFDGIQQYVTIFFRDNGIGNSGFISLILIYAAFMVTNLFSASIVNRLGSHRSLLLVYGSYVLYCLSLPSKIIALIYLLSILLGVAAGVLWTAQKSYLIRCSKNSQYGANAGFFGMSFAIGAGLGVFLMGQLIPHIGTETSFILFSIVIALAGFCFWHLGDIRGEKFPKGNMAKMLRSPTAVRYSMFWLAFNFIQGLVLGIIPLKITDVIGIYAVGPLVGLFYISPIVVSYLVGKSSDATGRRAWTLVVLSLSIVGLLLIMLANSAPILIAGIVVLSLNFGISSTVSSALVGDLTNKENTEHFSALVGGVQAAAILVALLLSALLIGRTLYIFSLLIVAISILVLIPILSVPLSGVRNRIDKETS